MLVRTAAPVHVATPDAARFARELELSDRSRGTTDGGIAARRARTHARVEWA